MLKALLVLVVILQSQLALGQSDSANTKSAGFEGAHAAFVSAFVLNSVRLNIDASVLRGGNSLLGLRGMFSTDAIEFSHSSRPRRFAYGALAFLGIRSSKTQFDLAVGPVYVLRTRYQEWHGWHTYVSGDLRVPLYDEYLSLLLHASTQSGGVGIAVGWMRR
jgi:hypothetical protein